MERVTSHNLVAGHLREIDYLVFDHPSVPGIKVHNKMYGSERMCTCDVVVQARIRQQLELPIGAGGVNKVEVFTLKV